MADVRIRIGNGTETYEPVVEGSVTLETERKGAPGKLTFNIIKDDIVSFAEGNKVMLQVDGADIFLGYVFSKKRDKDGIISVTAYDQLRYFKNKDIFEYENLRADEVIATLAGRFRLQSGEIENTKWKIEKKLEDNKTLFDIAQSALDETIQNTGKMHVLYDDFGKLILKNIESMQLDYWVLPSTAENFDYQTSIDGETYNKIRLAKDNKETGKREIYEVKSGESINQWGVLQLTDKIDEKVNGRAKADALLKLYNQKTRNLSVKNALGDIRVRGGCSIPVSLNLGDLVANNYMVVEKVKHTLEGGTHFMDLTMREW